MHGKFKVDGSNRPRNRHYGCRAQPRAIRWQGTASGPFPSTAWYTLTPDETGHYINGKLTAIQSSHCPHGEFASQVLQDGRVFVAGGEYGASGAFPGCATASESGAGADAEIYDPVANTWTMIDPPISLLDPSSSQACGSGTQAFYDMISETLPNGSVLMAPVKPNKFGDTLIYDPKTVPDWSFGGKLYKVCYQSEASWVKLPDGSILTVDSSALTAERYLPLPVGWIPAGSIPASSPLYDTYVYEEGPAFLLPNGQAIFIGSAPYTDIYTPSTGSWTAGPPLPYVDGTYSGGMPDAPGAMMVNGKILLLLSHTPTAAFMPQTATGKPEGVYFYEYDYTPTPQSPQGTFTSVSPPPNFYTGGTTDGTVMLDLPDGTVLFDGGQLNLPLFVYQPTGSPLPGGQPVIRSITKNPDGFSYHLIGTNLNGISEGAAFGDDGQMASNYPLVRLTDAAGKVTYTRTHDWSSTGVMTGPTPVSTEFALPASILLAPWQNYSLQVVANGNASNPISFAAGTKACTPSCTSGGKCGASDGCGGSCTGSCPAHTREICKYYPNTGYQCVEPSNQ